METLETAQLLTVRDQNVELQHPLVRAAIHGSATSTEVRPRERAAELTAAVDRAHGVCSGQH